MVKNPIPFFPFIFLFLNSGQPGIRKQYFVCFETRILESKIQLHEFQMQLMESRIEIVGSKFDQLVNLEIRSGTFATSQENLDLIKGIWNPNFLD